MSKNDDIFQQQTQSKKSNLKVKDSIFRSLFSEKENVLDMYRYLHPEDTTTTAEDITIVTLENILSIYRVNDLGFSVGNRLLILVEAQTNWSVNILVRSFLYLAETIKNHLAYTNQDLLDRSKVELPSPELYVVYTGPSKVLPDEISMQQEFFPYSNPSIEVKIKIIYNKYYKGTDNIFLQYMKFLNVLYENLAALNKPSCNNTTAYNEYRKKSITKAVDYCIEHNILRDFLLLHRTEVIDTMGFLYNAEELDRMRINAAEARGEKRGEARGEARGEQRTLVNNLKALISNNIEPEKAMELLNIPLADRPKLLALLAN